jgi:hypothetical protein
MTVKVQNTPEDSDDPGKAPDNTEDDKSTDGGDDQRPEGESRPEGLPEKFKSWEDMAKAYGELETKLSQGASSDDDGDDDASGGEDDAGAAAATKAGFDYAELQKELLANDGKLTDESYGKFEEAGFSREVVNQFIAGQQALGERLGTKMASIVGGQEALDKMLGWATTGLTEAEIAAFNAAMGSNNEATMAQAVRALKSSYVEAEGNDPDLIRDSNARDPGVKPFRSTEEMVEAMSDRRYKTDEAYRADVAKRMAVS